MSFMQFIKFHQHHIELKVWVKPNSSQMGILGFNDLGIILAIQAPAIEGKANQAIIETFARIIRLPKTQIDIIKGLKNRQKTIKIPNNALTQAFIERQFNS